MSRILDPKAKESVPQAAPEATPFPRGAESDHEKKAPQKASAALVTSDYDAVVAIDFGTARSGTGGAMTKRPHEVFVDQSWPGSPGGTIKPPTTVLLSADGKTLLGFGDAAERLWADSKNRDELLLFSRFKMGLYPEQAGGELTARPMFTAANGQKLPAVQVIRHLLLYLGNFQLQRLRESTRCEIPRNRVKWVITVPAIFSNGAKQVMREAAEPLSDKKEDIVFALEPEAAALSCVEEEATLNADKFTPGFVYGVLDAGGGTADLAVQNVYKSRQENAGVLQLAEVCAASGGPFGSTKWDEAFVCDVLMRIFGEAVILAYKSHPDWQHMLNLWEALKFSIVPEYAGVYCFKLTFTFIQHVFTMTGKDCEHWVKEFDVKKASRDTQGDVGGVRVGEDSDNEEEWQNVDKTREPSIGYRSGALVISSTYLLGVLFPTVNKLANHAKELFTKHQVQCVFLVGGFAQSEVVLRALEQALGCKPNGQGLMVNDAGVRLIRPRHASLAVIKGAVKFGMRPDAVAARVVAKGYGVSMSVTFDPQRESHRGRTLLLVAQNGKPVSMVQNAYRPCVVPGQLVPFDHSVSTTFFPIRDAQDQMLLPIHSTTAKLPEFADAPDCKLAARLLLDMPNLTGGLSRAIKFEMHFGDTEMRVTATGGPGEHVRAFLSFLDRSMSDDAHVTLTNAV